MGLNSAILKAESWSSMGVGYNNAGFESPAKSQLSC